MQPLSSHFRLKVHATFQHLLTKAGVSHEQFDNALKYGLFFPAMPATSPENFVAVCDVISEIRLPRSSSLVQLSVGCTRGGDSKIHIRSSATATSAGRDYLRRLADDTTEALRLFDLFESAAISHGWAVQSE